MTVSGVIQGSGDVLDGFAPAGLFGLGCQAGDGGRVGELLEQPHPGVAGGRRGMGPPRRPLRPVPRAEAALATGDRTGAQALLQAAADQADRLGARPLKREVELLARRGGIPLAEAKREPEPPAVDATSQLKLTPREAEVLRLVADGWTNRKIATSLFITEKTTSVHVSRILAKLGAANRGEAAALAHKLRLFDDNTHADPPA